MCTTESSMQEVLGRLHFSSVALTISHYAPEL
jgi:hypothetical protein